MKNPNPLMLLRIAQADAFCMATEYIRFPRDYAVHEEAMRLDRYVRHPTHGLAAGQYTDDTQMSVAIAECLLEHRRGSVIDRRAFADAFVHAFRRDQRDGYSRGFQAILESSWSGDELLSRLVPNSTKNGAAMRSVPIGVLPDKDSIIEFARTQASVTHDTTDGIISSQAIALLSHHALYTDEPFAACLSAMAIRWPSLTDVFISPWSGPVVNMTSKGGRDVGLNTVHAVCTLLRERTDLLGILRQVMEWGGDTDSVAAIAWGIASTRMREPIPAFFESELEPNGAFGPIFLRSLCERLMEAFDDEAAAQEVTG